MYKLSKTQTLIDLNGNLANFKTTFTVTPTDNTIEYGAGIASQTMLDNGNEIQLRPLKGPFTGVHENNDGVYQNYFLLLKSENGVPVDVAIDVTSLDSNVDTTHVPSIGRTDLERSREQEILQQLHDNLSPQGQDSYLDTEDKNKRNLKYLLIFIVVLGGGFLLYYFWNKKDKKVEDVSNNVVDALPLATTPLPTPAATPVASPIGSPVNSPIRSPETSPLPRKFASRAEPFSFKPY